MHVRLNLFAGQITQQSAICSSQKWRWLKKLIFEGKLHQLGTRVEIQTASITMYVETNYQPTGSTNSGAILIHDEILLSVGGGRIKIHIYRILPALSALFNIDEPRRVSPFNTKNHFYS